MTNKFNFSPDAATATSLSAQKLSDLYKSGRFDYFTDKNVASSIDIKKQLHKQIIQIARKYSC